ncbi:MAG: hypothetical protein JRI95_06290 [Deltaproteobacteria bacterium]|nr:hypothetical protein [Deltaproteobacteria bacterium]MBW2084845.1 hypothetical protein [Deltaproteobacteria bacterium]
MDAVRKRLRLSSCVRTIVEVHGFLDPQQRDSILTQKFEQLKSALSSVALDEISESDIQQVEEATNRLLKELGLYYTATVQNLDRLGFRH